MRMLEKCLDGLARKVLGAGADSDSLWSEVSRLAVGISGTDFRYDTARFDEAIESLPFTGEVIHSSIGEVSYCGGCLMKPGILIRAGTGTTVYGIDQQGNRHMTNAWDPVLGDQGSGFAMTVELKQPNAVCKHVTADVS